MAGRINKIEKYHLQDETHQLKNMGYSYSEIIDILKKNHTEIEDLEDLSKMSVSRFFAVSKPSKKDMDEVETSLANGGDPVEDLTEAYRLEMAFIHGKSKSLYEKSMNLLTRLEDEDKPDSGMVLKAIKEARDSLDQLRRNQVSLKQYGEKRANAIYNVNLKKEINVKNMLTNYFRDLCPICRSKVAKVIEIEEEEEECLKRKK